MKINFLCIALLISIYISPVMAQQGLPARWEKGMTIQLTYGGGMRYYSYELLISDTGSYYLENNEGRIFKNKLHFNSAQLDSLMSFLNDQQFDKIESELTEPMHDKGSEEIILRWGGKKISIGTGHAREIKSSDWSRYVQVKNYLQQLRLTKK